METEQNILTHQEATKKLCPFITASDEKGNLIGNVRTYGLIVTTCQASYCMAWKPVVKSEDKSNSTGYCSRC